MAKPKYKTKIPDLPAHESLRSFAAIVANAAIKCSCLDSKFDDINTKTVNQDTSDYSGKMEMQLISEDSAVKEKSPVAKDSQASTGESK